MADFQALCAELVAALEPAVVARDGYGPVAAVLPKARAALAQPEPPTDQQLQIMYGEALHAADFSHSRAAVYFARNVLERWGSAR